MWYRHLIIIIKIFLDKLRGITKKNISHFDVFNLIPRTNVFPMLAVVEGYVH